MFKIRYTLLRELKICGREGKHHRIVIAFINVGDRCVGLHYILDEVAGEKTRAQLLKSLGAFRISVHGRILVLIDLTAELKDLVGVSTPDKRSVVVKLLRESKT